MSALKPSESGTATAPAGTSYSSRQPEYGVTSTWLHHAPLGAILDALDAAPARARDARCAAGSRRLDRDARGEGLAARLLLDHLDLAQLVRAAGEHATRPGTSPRPPPRSATRPTPVERRARLGQVAGSRPRLPDSRRVPAAHGCDPHHGHAETRRAPIGLGESLPEEPPMLNRSACSASRSARRARRLHPRRAPSRAPATPRRGRSFRGEARTTATRPGTRPPSQAAHARGWRRPGLRFRRSACTSWSAGPITTGTAITTTAGSTAAGWSARSSTAAGRPARSAQPAPRPGQEAPAHGKKGALVASGEPQALSPVPAPSRRTRAEVQRYVRAAST